MIPNSLRLHRQRRTLRRTPVLARATKQHTRTVIAADGKANSLVHSSVGKSIRFIVPFGPRAEYHSHFCYVNPSGGVFLLRMEDIRTDPSPIHLRSIPRPAPCHCRKSGDRQCNTPAAPPDPRLVTPAGGIVAPLTLFLSCSRLWQTLHCHHVS